MRLFHAGLLLLASSLSLSHAASKSDEPLEPCQARSKSGRFYDLNPMAVTLPEDGELKAGDRNTSWIAPGYDYPSNFTMNFCAPVVEEVSSVDGVDRKLWKNISAFYTQGMRTYSLGQLSTEPVIRGRKMVLNYTDGSPCGEDVDTRSTDRRRIVSQRKNAIISLLCELDPSKPKVSVALVGWSPDECTYLFEARSQYVCGNHIAEPKAVGPGSVFSLIVVIALAVYILGGVAYQRIVMNQRGWRQLPNYAMWAAMGNFLWGILMLCCSCCTRRMAQSGGYSQLPVSSRFRNQDAENRLIDGYDEEWDD